MIVKKHLVLLITDIIHLLFPHHDDAFPLRYFYSYYRLCTAKCQNFPVFSAHLQPEKYRTSGNRKNLLPKGWDDPVPGYGIPPDAAFCGHLLLLHKSSYEKAPDP